MRSSPACRQLLIAMSISRHLPPIGTAGFDRSCVSGKRRVPRPPPRMVVRTSRTAPFYPCAPPRHVAVVEPAEVPGTACNTELTDDRRPIGYVQNGTRAALRGAARGTHDWKDTRHPPPPIRTSLDEAVADSHH